MQSAEYQAINAEARERGLLVDADGSLELAPVGAGPIRGTQLRPIR
ncbi:MAG: hypothetical protein AAFP84_03565 [Actinomycetota bacterium]